MPLTSGYFRDADCILYVSKAGKVYYVTGPDTREPVWKECGALGDDTKPTTPDAEDFATFERTRLAYGIEA